MHRYYNRILLSFLAAYYIVTLIACNEEVPPDPLEEEAVYVTATTEGQADLLKNQQRDYTSYEEEDPTPWVFLEADEALLQSLEVNLDADMADEQVLVLKRKDEPDSPISLVVVDYDPVLNIYKRSWNYTTLATNSRTFSLSLSDVIGDHKLELVCLGSDTEGRQTLSILWRSRGSEGPELVYSPVCEIAVSGNIEIIEEERGEAYQSGMKDGESFTIVTREHASDSENILDIVESTYFWDFKERRFIKMQEEFIPGDRIEEDRLAALFSGSDEGFLEFLKGPWYLSANDPASVSGTILFFEPERKRMILYTGNVQEIYSWKAFTRSLKNSIFLQGSNELLPYITNEVYMRVRGMDSISVTIRDIDSHTRIKTTNDVWSGNYIRLSNSSWQQIVEGKRRQAADADHVSFDLVGRYTADDGSRIVFSKPSFSYYGKDTSFSGVYSLYSAGGHDYLELRIFAESEVPIDKRLYRLEFSETPGMTEILRTITLTPGRMSAEGFVLSGDRTERYEQIETVDPDQS